MEVRNFDPMRGNRGESSKCPYHQHGEIVTLPLHTNRKPYMGSPTTLSDLTLTDPAR